VVSQHLAASFKFSAFQPDVLAKRRRTRKYISRCVCEPLFMKRQASLGPLPSCFFTLLLHISHTQLAATPRAKSLAIFAWKISAK